MTDRPYLQFGVEELERLFEAAQNDPVLLGALRRELDHRTVPKARALTAQVDEALLKVGRSKPQAPVQKSDQQLTVGCSQCGRANLVSVGVSARHFSCSGCLRPFVVEVETGIMKVTFPVVPSTSGNRLWVGLVLAAVLLAGLYFLLSAKA